MERASKPKPELSRGGRAFRAFIIALGLTGMAGSGAAMHSHMDGNDTQPAVATFAGYTPDAQRPDPLKEAVTERVEAVQDELSEAVEDGIAITMYGALFLGSAAHVGIGLVFKQLVNHRPNLPDETQ